MSRRSAVRTAAAVLVVAALSAPSALAQMPATTPQVTTTSVAAPQTALFVSALRKDAKVLRPIRAGLRSGRVSIVSRVTFADLTQDGRSDVVVRVTARGAAGTIAVYVLASPTPNAALRPVYRAQSLLRATARVDTGALLVRTPRYGSVDPLQRPDDVLERRLTWSSRVQRLVLRSTRVLRP